eukprot:scpid62175/ scgid17066/ 
MILKKLARGPRTLSATGPRHPEDEHRTTHRETCRDCHEFKKKPLTEWICELYRDDIRYGTREFKVPTKRLRFGRRLFSDVARILMAIMFVVQMVMFELSIQLYKEIYPIAWTLEPLWIGSGVFVLAVLMSMFFVPRFFTATYIVIFQAIYQFGMISQWTPLHGGSSVGLYFNTRGAAYIPHYATWMIYVLVALMPRLWWFMLGTSGEVTGDTIPTGFLVYTFLINLCMNVGYTKVKRRTDTNDPFRLFYLTLKTAEKSVLAILDAEAILNEVGAMQKTFSKPLYLAIAIPILFAVSYELITLTLEVSLRDGKLWTYSDIHLTLKDKKKPVTSLYGRANLIVYIMYLMLEILGESMKLFVRVMIAIQQKTAFSSFVYKNVFVTLMRLTHVYSMCLLLVAPLGVGGDSDAEESSDDQKVGPDTLEAEKIPPPSEDEGE